MKPSISKEKKDLPQATQEEGQGRVGVHLVGLKVENDLKWTFREKPTSDIGIDGEIEVKEANGSSHGRLIAVQIKCGPSYLKEKTSNGHTYRGDYAHLRYWSNFSVPVIIILCDPASSECWWVEVNPSLIKFNANGWSIEVPNSNLLNKDSRKNLEMIAARFQKKDLIELMLRDWIGWNFGHKMRLASDYSIPRDYHWFSHLGAIAEDDYYMIDYLLADIEGFKADEINEMLRHAAANHREFSYKNFLLAFISESLHHLKNIPPPPIIPGVTIQYVPLLVSYHGTPGLYEVGDEEKMIEHYEYEWINEIKLNRFRSIG
jgi:hypothetical protein